jgi:short-subunit dehydrogenase
MERILLTGASRGIGVAIAETLARRGAHIALAARSESGLQATAERVRSAGGTASIHPCDVSSSAAREALVDAVSAEGPLTALVNNAGVEVPRAVVDQSPADVERQLLINLHAPIHLAQLVLPGMIARGTGAVVMISSMSGKSPTPYNAIYTATKHGLNGFTASLRIELEGTGVHAGVVCPSFVADAGMWSDTGVKAPAMLSEVPLQRVADATVAVLDGAPERLVTPSPVRPLLALNQLFPSLDRRVLGWLGVLPVLKQRAQSGYEGD